MNRKKTGIERAISSALYYVDESHFSNNNKVKELLLEAQNLHVEDADAEFEKELEEKYPEMIKLDLSTLQEIVDKNLKWYEEGNNKLEFQLNRANIYKGFIEKISTGNFHACEFDVLSSREKWDIYKVLSKMKSITWHCPSCGSEQTINTSEPFHGCGWECGECGCELTHRTGGGQNDPFNWTFKIKNN